MKTTLGQKSSLDQIRQRFDVDVERFSNLETGQAATIDAPLTMELISQAAIAATPRIGRILDLGCGAGNQTISLLRKYSSGFDCDLCDLSGAMLERARQRVAQETTGTIQVFAGDFATLEFSESGYDVVLAAAVLHHLREDADWQAAFAKVFRMLRPGGSFWITDLVTHGNASIQALMWERYGRYLEGLGGPDYRQKVFDYIDQEDSPRPLTFQLDLLREVGFSFVEVLHKNSCFAAFGAIKAG